MAYCTEAELVARFGDVEVADLLDRDNSGTADTNALASAQTDADALIDGYLAGRYSVPLASAPALIVGIAANLVRYILWGNNAPEEIRKRYDDSIARLKDLSAGKLTIPAESLAPLDDAGGVDYYADERIFTSTTLAGF